MEAALKKENKLFADRVGKLAEHTKFGLAGTLINSIVLVIVLWELANRSRLFWWFLGILLISTLRIYLQNAFDRFKTSEKSLKKWKNYFLITLAISGIIWGSAGVILFPTNSLAHQSFIAFVIGGMVAGAVGVFSVMLVAFLSFSVPALLPLTVKFYLVNDPIHLAMGFMLSLFWIIMLLTAKRLNRDLLKSFLLKYENSDLISDLEAEVKTRITAEKKLKKQKNEIEKIVDLRTMELQETNAKLTNEIEERKMIAKALEESKEKYQDLVENINDVIYSVNTDGTVTYISPVVESMLGYKPSEIVGEKFSKFIYKDDLQLAMSRFDEVLAGKFGATEYRLLSKTGEYRWVRSSSRTIYKEEKICGLSGAFIDISERKRFETERANLETQLMQAQKMESIGTLAGGIAHEFNNILSIIIGHNELVMAALPTWSHERNNLEEIRIAGIRARDVVRQLLMFSRQDGAEKKPLDIGSVVKEAMKLIRSSIPANIDINLIIPDDVAIIFGNATQLNQMLINLCGNAADAMLNTGGMITIELSNETIYEKHAGIHPSLKPGRYIKLLVSDTGCGMDKKTLDRIFEPYFTTKDIGKGTGIGLAVIYGIIERHEGSISVESKPNEGTVFTILLPAYEGLIEQKSEAPLDLPTGNERILLVDDDHSLLKLGKLRLKSLGYSVQDSTDPLEALETFEADPDAFDLVITDMAMPRMTGDQLASEILIIRPKMPIILCTGYSEKISEEKAYKIGICAFVMKPLDQTEFATSVRKVLDKAKGSTQN